VPSSKVKDASATIWVQAGTAYQLNAKDFDAKKSSLIAKKVGDDLEVALEEGVIIFDNR
jgi:hypothetical protein